MRNPAKRSRARSREKRAESEFRARRKPAKEANGRRVDPRRGNGADVEGASSPPPAPVADEPDGQSERP